MKSFGPQVGICLTMLSCIRRSASCLLTCTYTLAQRGILRFEDAIHAIEDLIRVLDDHRFKNSPFSPCRDVQKTKELHARLTALRASMGENGKQLHFAGVFLERQELIDKFPQIIEADKTLIRKFGLEPLPIEPTKTLRISMLSLKAASINDDPQRIILPVLHYLNADPSSGKYAKQDDDSAAHVEWTIRYLCLRPIDIARIKSLPDEGQTPEDIDLIVTPDPADGFGYNLSRISKHARWRLDPEIASRVNREAAKVDAEFGAKFASVPDVTIVDDLLKSDRVTAGASAIANEED